MRILFAMPHYCPSVASERRRHGSLLGRREARARKLKHGLLAIRQLFGRPQCLIDIAGRTTTPTNQSTAGVADVVVCTTGDAHALDALALALGEEYFTRAPSSAEPELLGFECHRALRERIGGYDYYCYLEDDLLIEDPTYFVKVGWFAEEFGAECVLMPNRFERGEGRIVHKAYVDGPLKASAAERYQDRTVMPRLTATVMGWEVAFERPTNPHSGTFCLTAGQMESWAGQPDFLDRDTGFVGPLESAASLGVMKHFRVYKSAPENACFLEVEHQGSAFLGKIRHPEG